MSDKFKALSFTAKIQYIWEFYKLRITLIIAAIAFAVALIHGLATNARASLYCVVFNELNNEKIEKRVKSEYSDYTGCSQKEVSVNTGFGFRTLKFDGIKRMDEGSSIRFLSAQSTNEMDVIITDYDSMVWAESEEFLSDVKEVLPPKMYKKLEPYFVYAKSEEGSTQSDDIVYALDISNTDFYKGYSDNYSEAMIAFPNCSKNADAAIEFVECVYKIK